jgi:internalin A
MSELALKLIKEAKEKRLTRLDLGNCGLTELPDALFELVWLEELILYNDDAITAIGVDMGDEVYEHFLERMDKEKSENNVLKNIPSEIRIFKNLKRISVNVGLFAEKEERIWQLSDISALSGLTNLQRIELGNTKVTDLSPLSGLINLERLELNNTKIIDLSPLSGLINLKRIDINNTKITDLSPLSGLQKLEHIEFCATLVNQLSPLIGLKNLQNLSFNYTNINNLDVLKELSSLQIIYAHSTKIKDLRALTELRNLKELYIGKTQVIDLYPLKELTNLRILYIDRTPVKDISPLNGLINLITLNLSQTNVNNLNPLKDIANLFQINIAYSKVSDLRPLKHLISPKRYLPVEWQSSTLQYNSPYIFVEDCPLTTPPRHIIEQGNEAILRYWQELETKETQTNNQTKLIFIGNSRAGKTSLWQFLKDRIYTEQADSTHGIKTEIWDTETLETEDKQNLAAHIWDFGGQEYYHATHRLFLAENAVYVLVWEKDSNKQGTRLEKFKLDDDPNGEIEEVDLEHFPTSYWLDNIRYFGGAHCPVLIVQNKVDEEHLKANYTDAGQNIEDCFHLSVQNAYHFQEGNATLKRHDLKFQDFKERLLELLRKNATAFKLVKYYAQVREALEALAKEKEFITVSELKEIALGFDETPDLENLLAYLKSFTNTILYFPQNPLLQDRLFLNPTHISRDIYKILNKTVRDNKGKFNLAHIKTRLNLPNHEEVERFLALMHEFDLIFEKHDENDDRAFIAPQYLQQKAHLATGEKMILKTFQPAFYLRFKSFVPRSMMLRFIAQNGASAFEEFYWRNGIVYQGRVPNTFIKVEYDSEARTFAIDVQDKDKQAVDMQQVVEQFVKLNNSDDNIDISNDGKTYIELKTIRKLQHENRRDNIFIEGHVVSLDEYDWLIKKQKTNDMTMTLKELKEKVRNLISKAKIKEAMDEIATWAHEQNQEQLKNDISVLKSDFTDLSREKTLGLLGSSEANIRQNQLANRVLSLLNSIEETKIVSHTEQQSNSNQEKRFNKPISVFISYSKSNIDYLNNFKKQLKPLERNGSIKVWDDSKLVAGEVWKKAIENQLNTADIIVFLVSADMISTDYVWDVEMVIAFDRHKKGEVVVVPVILEDCGWQQTDFKDLNALPEKGRPISTYRNQADGFFLVYEKIVELIGL